MTSIQNMGEEKKEVHANKLDPCDHRWHREPTRREGALACLSVPRLWLQQHTKANRIIPRCLHSRGSVQGFKLRTPGFDDSCMLRCWYYDIRKASRQPENEGGGDACSAGAVPCFVRCPADGCEYAANLDPSHIVPSFISCPWQATRMLRSHESIAWTVPLAR